MVVVVVVVFFVKATPSPPKKIESLFELNHHFLKQATSSFLRERSDLVEHADLTLFLTGSRSF